MTTDWTHSLYFVVLAAENTAANRTAFAEAFSFNGSLESVDDERKMFDSAVRFSVLGTLPAQGFGIASPVKPDMRTALVAFTNTLNNYRYFVEHRADGVLVATNSPVLTPPVANWTRRKVLQAINEERVNRLGLSAWQVIQVESEIL